MGEARLASFSAGKDARAFAARVACFCCAAISLTAVQAAPSKQQEVPPAPSTHLLSAKQGRAIVNAARTEEQPERGVRDCSHLVHEIYARAGFTYPYASSFDLYAGSDNFARVKDPQPGDVIVWPGHAGIVFDPKEHIFYSLVRSGIDTEDYQAPYWKSRGRPRFFRYVMGKHELLTEADNKPAARTSGSGAARNGPGVVEDRSDDGSTAGSAREASERSPVFASVDPEIGSKPATPPHSIVIAEGRKPPTREEVANGISELSSASGGTLRSASAPGIEQVIVYEQMQITNVEIKRDRGWAFVQLESRASIVGSESDLQKRSEEVRWELRRGKLGWEAVMPAARAYVPRDVAVRELSLRLARLTQTDRGAASSDPVRREETQLAKLLNALLQQSSE